MLYICTKFQENILKGFRVIEQTQFVTDRWMDIQTGRQLWEKQCLPPDGGDIISKYTNSRIYGLVWSIMKLLKCPKSTVMCLSIGTPKSNKFSICSKCKINYFRCPKIWEHYSLIIMCSNIGTPKSH